MLLNDLTNWDKAYLKKMFCFLTMKDKIPQKVRIAYYRSKRY
uniref:Uncharacterized protein n=1 Tax=Arundo donax TaxID=35708 RepID=A0A0A9FFT2_ARUDO